METGDGRGMECLRDPTGLVELSMEAFPIERFLLSKKIAITDRISR